MMISVSLMVIFIYFSLRVLMLNRRLKYRVKRGTVVIITAAMSEGIF